MEDEATSRNHLDTILPLVLQVATDSGKAMIVSSAAVQAVEKRLSSVEATLVLFARAAELEASIKKKEQEAEERREKDAKDRFSEVKSLFASLFDHKNVALLLTIFAGQCGMDVVKDGIESLAADQASQEAP